MKRRTCSLRDCTSLVIVPDNWSPQEAAYCTQFHRDIAAAEKGLYLRGVELGHPESCPGCLGSGVEDNDRWGGDLALCSWPQRDGKPVSGDEARRLLTVTLCTDCHLMPAMDPPSRNLCLVCAEERLDAILEREPDHMVDAMRYLVENLKASPQPASTPITDRWWFWVGAGALAGAVGGLIASLFW